MASTWNRTITTTTDAASLGLTRAQVRENLVEQWLGEANATFFNQGGTDNTLNMAIDWAQRRLVQAMGGIDARWDVDTLSTAPYEQALPSDMVWYEKATYNPAGPTGAGVKELDQLEFDDAFAILGREWRDDDEGTPEYIIHSGWRTIRLHPAPDSVVTNGLSVFGRSMPTDFSSDSIISVLPRMFDDGLAAGAFVFSVRRLSMHNDQVHPMYQEGVNAWAQALDDAKKFSKSIPVAELVIAGTVPTYRGRYRGYPYYRYDFEV